MPWPSVGTYSLEELATIVRSYLGPELASSVCIYRQGNIHEQSDLVPADTDILGVVSIPALQAKYIVSPSHTHIVCSDALVRMRLFHCLPPLMRI